MWGSEFQMKRDICIVPREILIGINETGHCMNATVGVQSLKQILVV